MVRLAAAKQPIPESVDAFFTDGSGLQRSNEPWSAFRRGFHAVSDEEWQDVDQKRTTDRLLATLCFGNAVARMPGAFALYSVRWPRFRHRARSRSWSAQTTVAKS